jgi:uncharacterized delta-60 repeat protein
MNRRTTVRALIVALFTILAVPTPALAAPGDRDPTFGRDGKVTTAFSSPAAAAEVVVQPDGRIVAVGSGGDRFRLARYLDNGHLDPTFDGDGRVTTIFAGPASASDAALLSDGRILAVGSATVGGRRAIALAMYRPSGALDPAFGGGDGRVTTTFPHPVEGHGVALQPDGRIVVAGALTTAVTTKFAVARYLPGGSLDDSFGGDGRVTTGFANGGVANAVVIQEDGSIVAVGLANHPDLHSVIALVRYLPGGALDPTYDVDGKFLWPVETEARAFDAVLRSDGSVLVVGSAFDVGFERRVFILVSFAPEGGQQGGFGNGPAVVIPFGPFDSEAAARAVTLDGSERIIVAGFAGFGELFALARVLPDGKIDQTFGGGDGKVTTAPRGSGSAFGVAVQADGKIVAAGSSDNEFGLVRYLP